jgi:hypothetical protein
MKTIIAVLAVLAVSTPALADRSFDKEAYEAAKSDWKSNWDATRESWNNAGKPDPKPTKPDDKPRRSDFRF